ncbi:hypothetical protein K8T06_09040 [bacterium]|nr:hypothetical protein [bacterium]
MKTIIIDEVKILIILCLLTVFIFHSGAVTIPEPPSVSEIAIFVDRPSENCNAADIYLHAEKLYRDTELKRPPEERNLLDPDSEIYELIEKGLKCSYCEFPYSLDMKLPPYEQMIPMMALYRAAARTWRKQGDEALEAKEYNRAKIQYSKAVNLGLQLFEEPGITIIQDMISFSLLQEGIEGLGDLFIALGEADKAATCARFLALRMRYIDELPRFINSTLRDPDHEIPLLTNSYKSVARIYPTITYNPIKVEIILTTAEIYSFNRNDEETSKYCHMVFDTALKDPDLRIRKVAKWAMEWDLGKFIRNLKAQGIEISKDLLEKLESK